MAKHYALAREAILAILTAYSGITTDDGNIGGTTLRDRNLIGKDSQKIVEKTILIMSGDADWEDKGAASFAPLTGIITLQSAVSAQIKAGTIFRILNISSIEIDVETINTKVGTNADAAGTTTLFAWLLKLFEQGGQGLVYYGEVTTYTDVTHFRVSGLTGFGDDYFANNYRVYVVWDKDGAGAAPQGEMQPCSDYDSTDGIFTHTAFTAPLEVGDKVLLIHERLAEIADILADIGDASASTLGSIYAILGNPATALATQIATGIYGDRIYFDEDTGIAGTAYPVGTPQVPSDVIADIITMCVARNLYKIQVHGALTLGDTMEHYCFFGSEHEDIADILDLSGEDVDGSHMEGLIVTGAQGGTGFLTLIRCLVNTLTNFQGQMNRCSLFAGTCSFKDLSYIDLIDCESIYGAVTITVQAPTRASIKNWRGNLTLSAQDGGLCHVRGFKGTLVIDAMTLGTLNIFANGADITINNTCTAGTINIYGNARVTDNSGAGCTVTNYTLDTALTTHNTALGTHDTDIKAILAAGGFGGGLVTKALTFANQTGQVALFTVTGDVIVRVVAVVKTGCGSVGGCNVSVGIAANVDAIIPVTDITLLAAQEIWHDAAPDSEIEALGTMREHIITDGNDITLDSDAADNSGAITFYCFWTALSSGATVVAA